MASKERYLFIRNSIRHRALTWAEEIIEKGELITPKNLDLFQESTYTYFYGEIGRNQIRTHAVQCILDNFGTSAFGVTPYHKKKELDDKTIKKYAIKK